MSRRARRHRRRARQRVAVLALSAVALVAASAALFIAPATSSTTSTTTVPADPASANSSTTSTTAATSAAATTSTAKIPPTKGWGVIATTGRGVAVDQRWITVPGGARVFVLRFRKGATAFHLHVGSEDPPGANAAVPADAQAAISAAEWRVGVLGVFNGGFKQAADAGGLLADGHAQPALKPGEPTLVIDDKGQATIGTWGVDVPKSGDPVIEARQNLGYLVLDGAPTVAASDPGAWGQVLHGALATARTGVGVDAAGDVLYAVGSPVLPIDLARALADAHAVRAMELDINPFWPISGASTTPLHAPAPFKVVGPFSQHDPTIYADGWLRDYFVVMAEPTKATCWVRSRPPAASRVVPETPAVACARGG